MRSERAGHSPILLRDGRIEEAEAICDVLRRSIVELCEADHRNDPAVLGRWLSNKTVEDVRSWLDRPDSSLLVAVHGGSIVAVGSFTDAGLITLNYMLPDFRFRGAGRALLSALEARARERGALRLTLFSTETAHRFIKPSAIRTMASRSDFSGRAGAFPCRSP